jgi:hypothetical protein
VTYFKITETKTEITEIYVQAESKEAALLERMVREKSYRSFDHPQIIIFDQTNIASIDEINEDEMRGAEIRWRKLNTPIERSCTSKPAVLKCSEDE